MGPIGLQNLGFQIRADQIADLLTQRVAGRQMIGADIDDRKSRAAECLGQQLFAGKKLLLVFVPAVDLDRAQRPATGSVTDEKIDVLAIDPQDVFQMLCRIENPQGFQEPWLWTYDRALTNRLAQQTVTMEFQIR